MLHVVDRAVPAPDGAVVQPQVVQRRHPPAVQLVERVGRLDQRQQRRHPAHVVVEDLQG